MSLNKRARKAAVTVNLPFNSIVQIKLTQLYSTSSPPSSFDSPGTHAIGEQDMANKMSIAGCRAFPPQRPGQAKVVSA